MRAMMVVMYAIEIGVGTVRVSALRYSTCEAPSLTHRCRAVVGVRAGLWVHAHDAVVASHAQRGRHSGRSAAVRHVPPARVAALVRSLVSCLSCVATLSAAPADRLAHYGRLDEAKETMASLEIDTDDRVRCRDAIRLFAGAYASLASGNGFRGAGECVPPGQVAQVA